ncbi:hypothetical protein IV417_12625 [Alphaproteobacteria bacterium KMM 3653]|uniref:Uncharacterized protein n=1 Tax=Harenicola maris TaxID=2841044 RepID=A0AAP2CRA2_9RHOB|nr:hypothetical protein [Harenicola maris]
MAEACETLEAWHGDYNYQSSHSSRYNLTPIEFA